MYPPPRVLTPVSNLHQNHMAEDLLTCYDFGTTPANMHTIYNRVKKVQRPRPETDAAVLVDLADEGSWHKHLGNNSRYSDFLASFEKEMAQIGWQEMVNKRMFSRTEAADDFFVRCFSGESVPVRDTVVDTDGARALSCIHPYGVRDGVRASGTGCRGAFSGGVEQQLADRVFCGCRESCSGKGIHSCCTFHIFGY